MIYLLGSLANPTVLTVANTLREAGHDVFDQWMASGEGADERWYTYGKQRGWNFKETLNSAFVETAFQFDRRHIEMSDIGVMVMPCGRSAGLELGWMLGQGKRGYILYDGEPERPDLMAKLATGICYSVGELVEALA